MTPSPPDRRVLKAAVARGTLWNALTTAVAGPLFFYGLGVAFAGGDPTADLPVTLLRVTATACAALFVLGTVVLIPATHFEVKKTETVTESEAVNALVMYALTADILVLGGLYWLTQANGRPRDGWWLVAVLLVPAGVGAWRYAKTVCRTATWKTPADPFGVPASVAEPPPPYAPSEPEDAPRFADRAVGWMRDTGDTLDYAPASLAALDRVFNGNHLFRAMSGKPFDDSMWQMAYEAGCYLGEVIVRTVGGRWVHARETDARKLPGMSRFPLVLELPNGHVCNPLGRAFKVLDNGMEDSLVGFYEGVVSMAKEPRA